MFKCTSVIIETLCISHRLLKDENDSICNKVEKGLVLTSFVLPMIPMAIFVDLKDIVCKRKDAK